MKTKLVLALSLCVVVFFAGNAFSQSWCNGTGTSYYYYQGSYSPYSNGTCHGWTSTGSGHVFGVNMYWNQAGRNGVQSYVSDGYRYTHDMTDLNDNLHATGTYSTNFPSPYIDFDDDDGNGEREEAEATVENTSFPVVGRKYYLQFWYSWKATAGATGKLAYTPAISKRGCPVFCEKWDTHRYDRGLNRSYKKTANRSAQLDDEFTDYKPINPFDKDDNQSTFEHRRFDEHISLEQLQQQAREVGIAVRGYAIEVEVATEDGLQVITVGLVPGSVEFFPQATYDDVLASMPEDYRVVRSLGVRSYYFDKAQLADN